MAAGVSRLVLNNINGSRFRSAAMLACAALVAGLAMLALMVLQGTQDSLEHGLNRLGADIVVMPWGIMEEELDTAARLMAFPSDKWMPLPYLQKIQAVDGVAEVSPQSFISSFSGTTYCPDTDLFVVAYDPQTDFALTPWLEGAETASGLTFIGSDVQVSEGSDVLQLSDRSLPISGRLSPTGTKVDKAVFVSYEAAKQLSGLELGSGEKLQIAPERVSAAFVRVAAGHSVHDVAVRILEEVPSVIPIEATDFFQKEREQMLGLLRTTGGMLFITMLLSVLFIGLVFSLSVNERRREIGMLRALGAKRSFIFKVFLIEGAVLAIFGGVAGMLIIVPFTMIMRANPEIVAGLPIHFPTVMEWAGLAVAGMVMALFSVTLAILIPATNAIREEPALAMKE